MTWNDFKELARVVGTVLFLGWVGAIFTWDAYSSEIPFWLHLLKNVVMAVVAIAVTGVVVYAYGEVRDYIKRRWRW